MRFCSSTRRASLIARCVLRIITCALKNRISESAARTLVERAVASYVEKTGAPPRELFIHGKARFDDDEWRGFTGGAPRTTEVVGVRIRHAEDLRIYRPGTTALLRGLAYQRVQRQAIICEQGVIP